LIGLLESGMTFVCRFFCVIGNQPIVAALQSILVTTGSFSELFSRLLGSRDKKNRNTIMPLPVGTKAPDFTLGSTSGKDFSLHRDMKNKPCILYFYPKDFSVGCTNEACSFRDTFEVFKELNITIIGISRDSLESHAKFKKTLALPFD
jgi:hypothetical protein